MDHQLGAEEDEGNEKWTRSSAGAADEISSRSRERHGSGSGFFRVTPAATAAEAAATTTIKAAANRSLGPRDDIGFQYAGHSNGSGITSPAGRDQRNNNSPIARPSAINVTQSGLSKAPARRRITLKVDSSEELAELRECEARGRRDRLSASGASSASSTSSAPSPDSTLPSSLSQMSLHHVLGIHNSPQSPLQRQFSSSLSSQGANLKPSPIITPHSDVAGAGSVLVDGESAASRPSTSATAESSSSWSKRGNDFQSMPSYRPGEEDDGIDEGDTSDASGDDVSQIRTLDLDTAIKTIQIIRREYVVFRLEEMAGHLKAPSKSPGHVSLDYDDLVALEDHLNGMHRILYGRDPSAGVSAAGKSPFPGGKEPAVLRSATDMPSGTRSGFTPRPPQRWSAPPGPVDVIFGSPPRPHPHPKFSPNTALSKKIGDGPAPEPRVLIPGAAADAAAAAAYLPETPTTPESKSPPLSDPAVFEPLNPKAKRQVSTPRPAYAVLKRNDSPIDMPVVFAGILAEAKELSEELETVYKNLNDRREENEHLWRLLAEGRDRDACRIQDLQGRIEEVELYIKENETELEHLRLQMLAVDVQCSQFIPQGVDPGFFDSIKNWKAEFEVIKKRWEVRRERSRSVRDDTASMAASFASSSSVPATTATMTTSTTTTTTTTTTTPVLPQSPTG